jgi:cysteine desulfurase/selenocysteine lyase
MIMNIQDPNGDNGKYSQEAGSILDLKSIEALAGQMYGTLPNTNLESPIPQITVNRPITRRTTENPIPGEPISDEVLTAIAKQLFAQTLPADLEARLQQAIAGIENVPFIPEPISQFPVTISLSEEALKGVAQQLYNQITPIFSVSKPELATPKTAQPSFYFLSPPEVEKVGLETGEPFDIQAIRQDFPILHQQVHGKPLIWMDNAATSQKPQSVIDTLSRFYEHDNSNIRRGVHTLATRAADAYEDAREKMQRFLGAGSASEIVFVRGTTEAINLVAQTYGRKHVHQGDEILVSTLEHHANIVPWQMLAREKGAILKVIPISDRGEILLEEYGQLLSPRTRIVALSHVSNAIGTILPVREMTEMAHRVGARVLIDGAQSVPHFPVNVQALDSDFYTFSGHKLFAPTGIGVLYGKRELLEEIPPWQGGGSMIRNVTFKETTYENPPAKFEAGTPSIGDAIALGAAIDYINQIGIINIEQYEQRLVSYATERFAQIPGLRLIGTAPHKVGVFSLVLENISPEEVGQRLDREGIAVRTGHHCAQPLMQRYNIPGTVRPSLALYNTVEEIDILVEVLRSIHYC